MDENKLKAIVKEVVNEAVEPITHRLDGIDKRLIGVENRLDGVEEQLNHPDAGLAAINTQLNNPDTGLAAINRRLDANTGAIIALEKTVKGYADMYKINDSNIRKMEKRLETLEEGSSINIPPELQLEPLSEIA